MERVHPVCGCHLLMFLNVPFTLALCLSPAITEQSWTIASIIWPSQPNSKHASPPLTLHLFIHPPAGRNPMKPFSIICSPALKLACLFQFYQFVLCIEIFFRMGKRIQTVTIRQPRKKRRKLVVRITSKCKAALKQYFIYTEQRRHQKCVWYWEIRSEQITVL